MNWDIWKRWFVATGRGGRKEYWTVIIATTAIGWLITAFSQATHLIVAPLITQVLSTWVLVCVSTRRLHDLGHSGWWQLVLIAIAFVAASAAELTMMSDRFAGDLWILLVMVAGVLLYLGGVVALGAIPGQSAPNRFNAPSVESAAA